MVIGSVVRKEKCWMRSKVASSLSSATEDGDSSKKRRWRVGFEIPVRGSVSAVMGTAMSCVLRSCSGSCCQRYLHRHFGEKKRTTNIVLGLCEQRRDDRCVGRAASEGVAEQSRNYGHGQVLMCLSIRCEWPR